MGGGVVGGREMDAVAMADEIGDRAFGYHAPVAEDGYVIAHLLDLVEQVTGQHDGPVAVSQSLEQLPHFCHAIRVEPVGRLIQEQKLRITQHGIRDAQPMLHAE